MQIRKISNTFTRKNNPTGATGSVNFSDAQQNHQITSPTALKPFSPAYFHPSFASNAQTITLLDELLDFVSKNPTNVTGKMLDDLSLHFNKVAKTTHGKFINNGKVGNVYRLSDKYVFKIPVEEHEIKADEFRVVNKGRNKILNMYYGGKILESENVSILKNADPERIAMPIGAPYNLAADREKIIDFFKKTKCLHRLSNAP